MIAGSPCLCGRKTVEISSGDVERVDESIDHPNWMVVADPVLQTIREQGRLLPVPLPRYSPTSPASTW